MKAILAATDFSPYAQHAVQYAAALAQAAETRLILFHFVNLPVPATDLPVFSPVSDADMAAEALRRLEALRRELLSVYDLEILCAARYLDLPGDLEEVFHEEDAALVVMGRRVRHPITGALFGSTAGQLLRGGRLPILLVPPEANFRPLRKIFFACDSHYIARAGTLEPLRALAEEFDAYVDVETFIDFEKMPTEPRKSGAVRDNLEVLLGPVRHGYVYPFVTPDLPEEILYQAIRAEADVVALIPHHHSRWAPLLGRSVSAQVAAETGIPMLVLGERIRPD